MKLSDFDDIRPYSEGEMQEAFDGLLKDRQFSRLLKGFVPWCPVGLRNGFLKMMFKGVNSPQDFQVRFMKKVVWFVLRKSSTGHSFEYDKTLKKDGAYTFISNHRDIVLDSAILDYMLHNAGFAKTCEIAIGNNLLIYPWIKTLVRMNKAFVVNRGLSPKENLRSSIHMSQYMHFAINEKKENIWIAQREGRAKDSSDHTQESVLKMLVLGYDNESENEKSNNPSTNSGQTQNPVAKIIAAIKNMNLVPLTLSYELDPCDYLKAQEFQLKRDVEGWKKAKQDDLDNMKTGILGKKGHIHFHASACINDWLDTLDPESISKTDIYRIIAEHIDHEIHSHYRIYDINKDAAAGKRNDYIEQKINMVELPDGIKADTDFLREKINTMYANPLGNYEKATH